MSKKKIAVMLTILLVTILSASCFYVIEKGTDPLFIFVNSYKAGDVSGDYEKVYGDANAPYTDANGKYFIRYTGKDSKRTVVDLSESGYGLTYSNNKVTIFGEEIKNTYKMFMQSNKLDTYANIKTVFVPACIAVDNNDGINENTFVGCNQQTDLIYHTGDLLTKNNDTTSIKAITGKYIEGKYDRTTKQMQGKAAVFVYLGNENIKRTSSSTNKENAYQGSAKNVYVSHEVEYPSHLFDRRDEKSENYGDGTLIQYALIADDTTWDTQQQELSFMFHAQTNLKIRDNFKMPKNAYGSLKCMFRYCSSIESFPSGFQIPSGVTNVRRMFNICGKLETFGEKSELTIPSTVTDQSALFSSCYSLKSLPETFQLSQNNAAVDCGFMFNLCQNLEKLPSQLVFPEGTTNLKQAFNECKNLKGIITIPSTIADKISTGETGILDCFADAGINVTDPSQYPDGYNTPIVMKYYKTCNVANLYTQNIYGEEEGGRVTKECIDGNWSKVYDLENGIYGNNNKYFIRYNGTDSVVDLTKASDDNEVTLDSDGYPVIFNQPIKNTYKMFVQNQSIKTVFIPASIAIESDGINENTFAGCEQQVDLIYHTGDLLKKYNDTTSDKAITGKYIEGNYDRTTKQMQGKAAVFVYLGNENIQRTSSSTNKENAYQGSAVNVYVSHEVEYPSHLFDRRDEESENYGDGTLIQYALIADDTTWDTQQQELSFMFHAQTNLQIRDNFKMPKNAYGSLKCMFSYCSSIESFPSGFQIPSGVTNVRRMFNICGKLETFGEKSELTIPSTVTDQSALFASCYSLKSLPESFQLSQNTAAVDCGFMFNLCQNLEKLPSQFVFPEGITNLKKAFNGCKNLKGIITIPSTLADKISTGETGILDCFTDAGTDVTDSSQYPTGYDTPIVMKYYKNCKVAAAYLTNVYASMNEGDSQYTIINKDGKVTKVCIDGTSSQISRDVDSDIVIDDEADEVSNENQASTEKIIIEKSTNYVTVIVNKKTVDEVTDEIQNNSRNIDSVETENKENEEVIQE